MPRAFSTRPIGSPGSSLGRFEASDENNALKTGYDPVARAWPDWLADVDAPVSRLPRVEPVGTDLGPVQASWATRWPCLDGARVRAGTTDGCAAFLASGASEVGDAVTSLGSTLVLKVLSDAPVFAPEYGLYSHRIGDRWLVGGASNSGGAVLAAHFSPDEMDALSARIDPERPTGLASYPLPGPGERFPINDARLAPHLPPRDDEAVFFQAHLEGIAQIERRGYALIAELGGPQVRTLRRRRRAARGNPAWTAIRQRLLRVPFAPTASRAEAAYGAARIAMGLVP